MWSRVVHIFSTLYNKLYHLYNTFVVLNQLISTFKSLCYCFCKYHSVFKNTFYKHNNSEFYQHCFSCCQILSFWYFFCFSLCLFSYLLMISIENSSFKSFESYYQSCITAAWSQCFSIMNIFTDFYKSSNTFTILCTTFFSFCSLSFSLYNLWKSFRTITLIFIFFFN